MSFSRTLAVCLLLLLLAPLGATAQDDARRSKLPPPLKVYKGRQIARTPGT